jgi:mono/diheme cytochrome c family protein
MFNGDNCMNCHYTEGRGEGWFSAAGSVTGNSTAGMVYLYQEFGQAPVASIQVDAVGNFYTTETIDFSNGLRPALVNDQGVEQQMTGKIYSGQCNLCHGVTQSVLTY